MIHYTATNEHRASHYYRTPESAQTKCDEQNAKAEQLGIKSRYTVLSCNGDGIDPKEVRG